MNLPIEIERFHNSLSKEDCFTFDIGNSNPNLGIWKQGQLTEVKLLKKEDIKNTLLDLPKERTLICSVSKEIKSSSVFLEFSESKREESPSFFNMPVNYEKTLGHDRLALASYLFNASPSIPQLIIDAGTFITIDYINNNGFQGGLIVPGIHTTAKIFQKGSQLFTAKEGLDSKKSSIWPQSTEDAIAQGHRFVTDALMESLRKKIDHLKKNYPNLNVVFTGGDGENLQKSIGTGHFHPELLHYGLYFQLVKSLS